MDFTNGTASNCIPQTWGYSLGAVTVQSLTLTVAAIGIISNLIIVKILTDSKRVLKGNPRFLVASQSAIDTIFSVILACQAATGNVEIPIPRNIFGEVACRIWKTYVLVFIPSTASTFNLQVITTERFVAIVFPMIRRGRTKVRIASACGWIIGILVHAIYGTYYVRGREDTAECCVYGMEVPPEFWKAHSVVASVVNFWFPLLNMLACYSIMIHKLRDGMAGKDLSQDSAAKKAQASMKLIKTLVVAGIAYVICFAPSEIGNLMLNFGNFEILQTDNYWNVAGIMVNLNAIVNPFIYFAFMPAFRAELFSLFKRDNGGEKAVSSSQASSSRYAANTQSTKVTRQVQG